MTDMQTFLMCRPDHFEVSYVINPWMAGNLGKVDKALAARQWQHLYDILTARADIQLIAPQPGLPDMVFTANAALVTPKHEAIIATFLHRERQGETPHYRHYFRQQGYREVTLRSDIVLEGAGDALFDAAGRLWLASGIRSTHTASDEVARALGIAVHSLTLIDPRWYHLDTAFCPLSNGEVIAYRKAFDAPSIAKIEQAFGERVLWVSGEDAADFSCNAVNIGRDVILYRASAALKAALARWNYNVIEVDVSEFMKSGGSCKCLTLEL